jgi:hypothetical protein
MAHHFIGILIGGRRCEGLDINVTICTELLNCPGTMTFECLTLALSMPR